MRRILLSAGTLALLAGSAYAADLPSRMAPPMVPPVPVFTWTGFYVGVNGGYAGDEYRYNGLIGGPGGVGVSAHVTSSGFVGGGQIGYNYQFGGNPFVIGLEADIQASGVKGEVGINANLGPGAAIGITGGSKTEYFGTVRGRLGYAAFDRMLAYVTGGFAWGNTKSYYSITGIGNAAGSVSADRGGWTLGGGVEYAVLPNWTIKAEYLYVDLGNSTVYNGNALGPNTTLSEKTRFNVVRAGVNYRF